MQNQHETLTVLADEKRNRWHHRALTMILKLSKARKQTMTPLLRQPGAVAYHQQCWRILSTALSVPVTRQDRSQLSPPRQGGSIHCSPT